jgi:hypothetical protein
MARLQLAGLSMALALAAGCASSGGSSGPSTPPDRVQESRQSNLITRAELEKSGASTALQAIRQLRPAMLRVTGAVTMRGTDPGVVVYSNGTKFGGVDMLEQIVASDVKQIEWLSASDATQRFGTGHPHGAILITRR